ncbi:MAG: imidazolonepropionase-like amidohydrolase [Parvicella sp.]|jgi:imidazolonepropionase-like amidohydrolase
MKNIIYIFLLLSISNWGQETPGKSQQKSILLLNGIAHIGDGTVINKSAIGIKDGKIILVKDALTNTIDKTKYDTVIDISKQHIYPSFIAPNTTLGLQEIGAVRASKDQEESGTINPNVRAIVAYNTDSDITPTVRTNGILVGQITPRGGVISGTSSVVHFDAWNWEDAVYRMDDGVHLNWPNVIKKSGWWAEPEPANKSKGYSDKILNIETFFNTAQAYSNEKKPLEQDLKLEAMRGVFSGDKSLYVHASNYKEINDVINFKKKYGISKVVIVGGHDAYLISKKLNENGISVILQRVHSLPERPEDDVYLPYKLPKLLNDAKVLFCLENAGDMEQMGTRNLPFYGGTAVAYGLEYEQAVQCITLNAAKILGVDNLLGSLTEGKDATFFISNGDALDMMTNEVTLAFVQGRMISLDNHQKRNYEKYKAKYEMK